METNHFNSIFKNKGTIGAIAEKALHNIRSKRKEDFKNERDFDPSHVDHFRLHYATIGHTFKQIDKNILFGYEYDHELKAEIQTKLKSLKRTEFKKILGKLCNLVDSIRNNNSHYIRTFDDIEVESLGNDLIQYLNDSFYLALVMSCYKVHKDEKEKANKYVPLNSKEKLDLIKSITEHNGENAVLKHYALNVIVPHALRQELKLLPLSDLINFTLYFNVDKDFTWKLNPNGDGTEGNHIHPILPIKAGKYLTFEASIFVLSMFLYKNDSNLIIKKIDEFKCPKENGKQISKELINSDRKQSLFTFYSKKYSSQDIDSGQKNLVYFRDIVQYLNKYPVAWKSKIEVNTSDVPVMKETLLKDILHTEVRRNYPGLESLDGFYDYTIEYLTKKKEPLHPNHLLFKDIIEKNDEVRKHFIALTNNNLDVDSLKNNEFKSYALKYVIENYFDNYAGDVRFTPYCKNDYTSSLTDLISKLETNRKTLKLKERIKTNMLVKSYGRNKDRYMQYAAKYLAESNYFGPDARFKMYKFYYPEEQNDYIEAFKEEVKEENRNMSLDRTQRVIKRAYDNLKYHKGKIVDSESTYHSKKMEYPEWDFPFVVENNAIHIIIEDFTRPICIQRNFMTYLLEDALSQTDPTNRGILFLKSYIDMKQIQQNASRSYLMENNSINKSTKTDYKKILPNRLLHKYLDPEENKNKLSNHYQRVLDEVNLASERYTALKNKAIAEHTLDLFNSKNKGRQFKLRFIRKAWKFMFFDGTYEKQNPTKSKESHHKRYNITRDEFNDFSKWMFAFGEVPEYKLLLASLFDQKGFYLDNNFKKLFESSRDFGTLYLNTKNTYASWVKSVGAKTTPKSKYALDRYEHILDEGVIYINVSHFRSNPDLLTQYHQSGFTKTLENITFLKESYYYSLIFNEDVRNITAKTNKNGVANKKHYNELSTAKLEDCQLYEMAMRYYSKEDDIISAVKSNVNSLLNQKVFLNVKDKEGHSLYNLQIEFKQIERYKELLDFNLYQCQKQPSESILVKLPEYLPKAIHDEKLMKYNAKLKRDKVLSLTDFMDIQDVIVRDALIFTKVVMAMEKYYLWKNEIKLEGSNRISIVKVDGMNLYFLGGFKLRGRAFHYNLPLEALYHEEIKRFEKVFISNELKGITFGNINSPKREMTLVFLNQNHAYLYPRKPLQDKVKEALEAYFNKFVNKNK